MVAMMVAFSKRVIKLDCPGGCDASRVNPAYQDVQLRVNEIQAASRVVGKQIHVLQASTESAIEAAFAALAQTRAGALLVRPTLSFLAADIKSWPSQRGTRSPQSINGVSSLRLAA
jgi:hypothetical protein